MANGDKNRAMPLAAHKQAQRFSGNAGVTSHTSLASGLQRAPGSRGLGAGQSEGGFTVLGMKQNGGTLNVCVCTCLDAWECSVGTQTLQTSYYSSEPHISLLSMYKLIIFLSELMDFVEKEIRSPHSEDCTSLGVSQS